MQYLDTVRIFLQPLYRILLSHHGPINIHLEVNLARFRVFQHQVINLVSNFHESGERISFHLLLLLFRRDPIELHIMIMIAKTSGDTLRLDNIRGLIENIANKFSLIVRSNRRHHRLDQIFTA